MNFVARLIISTPFFSPSLFLSHIFKFRLLASLSFFNYLDDCLVHRRVTAGQRLISYRIVLL